MSLAGIVAGCADQGGDTTTDASGSPAETTGATTETTTGPGGVPTESETTQSPTERSPQETESATETSPQGTETSPGGTETPGETTPGTATPEPDGTVVEMSGTSFVPMEVSVDPGTEVRWINESGVPHEVTSAQFNSGATQWEFSERADPGEEVNYTFDDPGTYEYYGSIYGESTMCGVVLVGDASRAGSLPCE